MTQPLVVVIGLALFALALVGLRWLKKKDVAEAAATLGLTEVQNGERRHTRTAEGWPCHETDLARGTLGGLSATLIARSIPNLIRQRSERVATQFTVLDLRSPAPPPALLRLQPAGLLRTVEQLTHDAGTPVPTGDAAFDAAFHLYTSNPTAALLVLDAEVRSGLVALADASAPPGRPAARRLVTGLQMGTLDIAAERATCVVFGSPTRATAERVKAASPWLLRLMGVSIPLLWICAMSVSAQQPLAGKRRLGPEINSDLREVLPIVAADGQTLYFVREDQGQPLAAKLTAQAQAQVDALEKTIASMKDPAAKKQMEEMLATMRRGMQEPARRSTTSSGFVHQTIWYSERQADGRWGAARRMPAPLSDDVATIWIGSILPDNNTMLVAGDGSPISGLRQRWRRPAADPARPAATLDPFGASNSLFAWSHRTATGWSQPELLPFRDFKNTSERFEIFLAPDGRHTIFSIRNAESLGQRDLYVSTLEADGVWSTPVNLGRPVNSAAIELSPFMAPDGLTLYFASDRPGGQGGFDLWLTRRLDDTWRNWSAPENLGADVNTKENDTNIALDASGRLAFMSIGPMMQEDIYEFELPPSKRPRPVAFVFGKVTDPAGAPLPAGIVYEFMKTGQGAGRAAAKPGDGRYQIALPLGEDFAFRASASGYVAVSDRIDLTAAKPGERFERNLILVPLEVGKPIRLNNVFFETAQTALLPDSTRELDRLVTLLNQMPTMRIEIRGHTDAVDDSASNLRLSQGRAASVMAFLVKNGIAPGRLQAKGFGETSPIASNATDEGRQLNRRVEFVILSK